MSVDGSTSSVCMKLMAALRPLRLSARRSPLDPRSKLTSIFWRRVFILCAVTLLGLPFPVVPLAEPVPDHVADQGDRGHEEEHHRLAWRRFREDTVFVLPLFARQKVLDVLLPEVILRTPLVEAPSWMVVGSLDAKNRELTGLSQGC